MDIRLKCLNHGLRGSIRAPASKSYAQRILIAAALADMPTVVRLNGISNDIRAAAQALGALCADITFEDGQISISPTAPRKNPVINCGESGTAARMLLPVAAAICGEAVVTGDGSLRSRPFAALCTAMAENGCVFQSDALPIAFTHGLQPGRYAISGGESSQYISGLMFALPLLEGDSEIELTAPLQSSGYIDMTLEILRRFGVESGYKIRGRQRYISPAEVTVEGDWSNAAFWLAAGVDVLGLNPKSLQKDRLFLRLKNYSEVDAADVPDLVPILAVNAAARHGVTRIYNAGRLKLKESDRLETVYRMLTNLGGDVTITGDGLIINGSGKLRGGQTDSFGDHRIAMSAAIASLHCEYDVIITNAEAVEKSYPEFFNDFNSLGGNAHVI